MSFSHQISEKYVISLPDIVILLHTCFLSNHYQNLQQENVVSLLSAAKNRINLSLIDHVLQHFKFKKLLFHRTKPNAFCTPLKKLELHQPISQEPFKILKKFKHI